MSLGVGQWQIIAVPDQRVEQARIRPVRRRHVLQEQLDCLTDVFPQHAGEVRLAFAGLLDGIQQPWDALFNGLE